MDLFYRLASSTTDYLRRYEVNPRPNFSEKWAHDNWYSWKAVALGIPRTMIQGQPAEASQKLDNSERKEPITSPLAPVLSKGHSLFLPLREKFQGLNQKPQSNARRQFAFLSGKWRLIRM